MSVTSRIAAGATLFVSGGILQSIGLDLIRHAGPPFDPWEFLGLLMVGFAFWLFTKIPWRA